MDYTEQWLAALSKHEQESTSDYPYSKFLEERIAELEQERDELKAENFEWRQLAQLKINVEEFGRRTAVLKEKYFSHE